MRLIDIDNIPSEILDGVVKNEKLDLPNTHITVRSILETQDTIEAIPKADYENRLKDDLEAILVGLQLEIEELDSRAGYDGYGMPTFTTDYIRKRKVNELIQDKIDALKREKFDNFFGDDRDNLSQEDIENLQ